MPADPEAQASCLRFQSLLHTRSCRPPGGGLECSGRAPKRFGPGGEAGAETYGDRLFSFDVRRYLSFGVGSSTLFFSTRALISAGRSNRSAGMSTLCSMLVMFSTRVWPMISMVVLKDMVMPSTSR